MTGPRLNTDHLQLRPMPAAAAAALGDDRDAAARVLGVMLSAAWPLPDLLDVLPFQADMDSRNEQYGIWVMIERETNAVVGDIGFIGPPAADGSLEIGYSVIPERRRRGYATEAANAMVAWALRQPGVRTVVAGCDRDNAPSALTLERTGFMRIGEVEGQIRWRHEGDQSGQA